MIKSTRAYAVGLVALLSVTMAACGGSSSGGTSATNAASATTSGDKMTATTAADKMTATTSGDKMTATTSGDDMTATTASGDATATTAADCEPVSETTNEPIAGNDLTVGLTFDLLGRGDQSFNDSAAAGSDKAKADLGVSVNEVTPTDASARGTDLQLQAENAQLVVGVGFSFATDAATVAAENPDVKFAIVDDAMMNFDCGQPVAGNAAGLVFSEEQGSYLVGVAAALKSTTGKIGFIGGVSGIGLIEKFEAGYTAGAKSINPDIEVTPVYITEFPDFGGFEDPARAKQVATGMYSDGIDIVYSAAGLSGTGTFQAAKETSESTGTKVWGIGVDSDQYNTVAPELKEYVLTSMVKHVDVAVFNVIQDVVDGKFTAGEVRYDLAADGVGYSTSGGFVDDITTQLEDAKQKIISGEVKVPTAP